MPHFVKIGSFQLNIGGEIQGSAKRWSPGLRECCRQSQAEVVSKSINKIHQTWGPPFSRALSSGAGRDITLFTRAMNLRGRSKNPVFAMQKFDKTQSMDGNCSLNFHVGDCRVTRVSGASGLPAAYSDRGNLPSFHMRSAQKIRSS